jgi:uncharacterized tellurite resistance protein B-like protein
MEFIGLIIFFVIVRMILSGIFGAADQALLPSSAKKLLSLSLEKDAKKDEGFTIYNLNGVGVLPNPTAMDLSAALYLYDSETNLPFLSNFSQTDESPDSRVFRRDVNFGYGAPGQYFPNPVPLSNIILEGIQHPHQGERNINVILYFFDKNYPVIFRDGAMVQGKENLIHYSDLKVSLSFDEPGYMNEIENADAAKPLMVEIAMQMAMSDGSLDKSEGDIIKKWIKNQIKSVSESKKDELKNRLNNSLESSYEKLSNGEDISNSIKKFNSLASKNLKYQLIEFCLDVLSADGVADEAELKNLENLTLEIDLNFDEVKRMKDKTLVKIQTKPSSGGQSASDESLIGMDIDLTKDEALEFIKKEYRKWNGRLNTLSPGNERDNAQRMLDALARLREKYEKE